MSFDDRLLAEIPAWEKLEAFGYGTFKTQELRPNGRLVWNTTSHTCGKKTGFSPADEVIRCGALTPRESRLVKVGKNEWQRQDGYHDWCVQHDPKRRSRWFTAKN